MLEGCEKKLKLIIHAIVIIFHTNAFCMQKKNAECLLQVSILHKQGKELNYLCVDINLTYIRLTKYVLTLV